MNSHTAVLLFEGFRLNEIYSTNTDEIRRVETYIFEVRNVEINILKTDKKKYRGLNKTRRRVSRSNRVVL